VNQTVNEKAGITTRADPTIGEMPHEAEFSYKEKKNKDTIVKIFQGNECKKNTSEKRWTLAWLGDEG